MSNATHFVQVTSTRAIVVTHAQLLQRIAALQFNVFTLSTFQLHLLSMYSQTLTAYTTATAKHGNLV